MGMLLFMAQSSEQGKGCECVTTRHYLEFMAIHLTNYQETFVVQ